MPIIHALMHTQYFAFPLVFFNFDTDFITPNCPGVFTNWTPQINYYTQVCQTTKRLFVLTLLFSSVILPLSPLDVHNCCHTSVHPFYFVYFLNELCVESRH